MITLRAETIARAMAFAIAVLVVGSIAIRVLSLSTGYDTMHGLVRFFDLDQEINLPTWYAATTLLLSAMLLGVVGNAERSDGTRARHWYGLGAIFATLSMDEAASFHEIFIAPTRSLLGLGGVLYFAWVVPAAVLLLFFMVVYARWFFALPPRTRKLMTLAGALFVGGAMGLELAGGLFVSRGEQNSLRYLVTATVEETLEMCGVLVWIYSILDYARARGHQARICFAEAPRASAHRG